MRKIIILCAWLLVILHVQGQPVFSNSITGTNPNSFNPYTDGQVHDPNLNVSGIGRGSGLNGSNANNRYNASGWTIGAQPDEQDYFEFTLQPLPGYQLNLQSFSYTAQASASGPVQFSFRSGLDGFLNDIGTPVQGGASISLSAASFQNLTTTISFRLYGYGGSSTAGTFSINDFEFTGTVTPTGNGPLVSISGSLASFISVTGQPSAEQVYQVSASQLISGLVVQAPAGYELSLASNSGYASTLNIAQVSGNISSTPVYVRLRSDIAGPAGGTLTHSSTGALTQSINLNGLVLAPEPLTAGTVTISNVTSTSLTLQFSGGSGNGRLVVMRSGSPVSAVPADGTDYLSNSQFGIGQALAPGEFVMMKGSAASVDITGLTGNTLYHIAVFEYNDAGVPEAVNYVGTAAVAQQQTNAAPLGLQVLQANTLFQVDFDHSSDHASVDQFNGTGFSASPLPGQLHSGAWSMSGWSDGSLAFNDTRTSGDYARGFTLSHPSTGGVYAFEPSTPGNRALGIQPGTGDWAPGHLTLRIQNRTGVMIHTLSVAYSLFVFNNADRSSALAFSWSADDAAYHDESSLMYQSEAAANPSATWELKKQSILLEGLAIAPGAWFYVRWSGSDVSGTGSRDEFALDDIGFIANPVSGSPLPVRFTTLMAAEQSGGILVNFETRLEENLEHHILERSADGSRFTAIRQFKAENNGSATSHYQYLDPQLATGPVYYRVRSVESSGQVSYSRILRITGKPSLKDLVIYPNPVADELVMQVGKLPAGRYRLKVYDAAGRVVMEKYLELRGGAHTETMTVGSLRAGWYSLQLSGPAALSRVFVKESR